MKQAACLTILLTLFALPGFSDVALGIKGGTLGTGADVTIGLSETVNLRGGFNYLNINFEGDSLDDDIDVDALLNTIPIVIDWHPGGGSFRITLGAMINGNKIEGSASTSNVNLAGVVFALDDFDAKAEFDDLAPYVGIGWGNALDEEGHWTITFDLGVMLQGSAEITASATATNPALQGAVDIALDAEVQDWEEEVEDYELYPVLTLGLAYRF